MNAAEKRLARLNVRIRTKGKKILSRAIVREIHAHSKIVVDGALKFLLPGVEAEALSKAQVVMLPVIPGPRVRLIAKADRDDYDVLLDEALEGLDDPMRDFISSGGEQIFNSIVPGEAWNPEVFAGEFLERNGLDLSTTVSDSLKADLRGVLAEAFANEQSVPSMKKALRESLSDWEGWKLERLVRTETNRATTQAAQAGYEQSGVVEGKEWLNGDPEFIACVELAGVIVPLRQDFVSSVGSFSGPPAHPNCESTIGPIVDLQDALAA